jgi:hypothetical protein
MKTNTILIVLLLATLFSCKNEMESKDPVIETTLAKSIAAFTCYAKASITERGSYDVLDHGFVYSTSNSNFGIENGTKISLIAEPLKADTFSTSFSFYNYGSSQPYYVRSYLTNKKGTVYGAPLSFRALLLSVGTLQPSSGKAGDKITITGENFSPVLTSNVVKFNNTLATVVEASASRLVVEVPAGITFSTYDSTVTIYVTVGGQTISSSFIVLPNVTGFSPTAGTFGTTITIWGENLSSNGLVVKCNDTQVSIFSMSNTSMSVTVPYTITSEKFSIKVIKNGVEKILPGDFTMNPLTIASINPVKGYAGSTITISGTNLNPGYDLNKVKIGGVSTMAGYVNQNSFNVTIPNSLTEGPKNVEVSNGITNVILSNAFTVVVPKITSFTPASGYYGSEITLLGENLSGSVYATIGNNGCELSLVNSSTIKIKVPSGTPAGVTTLKLTANNVAFYESAFTINPPEITSFSPASGTPGSEVTINGNGFTNYASVKFGTIYTTVFSISPTQIKVAVPSNAGIGAMKISVAAGASTAISSTDFTITN